MCWKEFSSTIHLIIINNIFTSLSYLSLNLFLLRKVNDILNLFPLLFFHFLLLNFCVFVFWAFVFVHFLHFQLVFHSVTKIYCTKPCRNENKLSEPWYMCSNFSFSWACVCVCVSYAFLPLPDYIKSWSGDIINNISSTYIYAISCSFHNTFINTFS